VLRAPLFQARVEPSQACEWIECRFWRGGQMFTEKWAADRRLLTYGKQLAGQA